MRSLHSTRPLVSVVSCLRNESATLDSFLASLDAQQCETFDLEIVLAEGGSTDGTRAALNEFARTRAHVRVVENPRHIVSTGLNSAIQISRGSIILRMDGHSRYASDYVACCLQVLRQRQAAMVGGPVRPEPGNYWQNATGLAYRSLFFAGGSRVYDIEYEGPAGSVPYGCWPREAIEAAGLFDEAMLRNQDDELSLRIQRAGGLIWQSAAIASWYRPRSSPMELARQFFGYGYWKVYTMRKHRLVVSARHLAPAVVMAMGIVLAGAAFLNSTALRALAIACLLYVAAILFASGSTLRKLPDVLLLPALLAVFPVAHFSYGGGTLIGLFRMRVRQ